MLGVTIVNDTLAYAVGEVFTIDSAGQESNPAYNLARWNGTSWFALGSGVNGTVTATIDATVKNGEFNGIADLSKIPFGIVMGATWWSTSGPGNLDPAPPSKPVNPQLGGPKTLKSGESWSGTMTITGIPRFKALKKAGEYGFSIEADPTKAVTETDEKNNAKLTYAADPCFGK